MFPNKKGGDQLVRKRSYLPASAGSFAVLLALALVLNAVYDNSGQAKATAIGSITYLEEKLDELVFPKDKVIDVKVTIDEEDFQDMLNNAGAEEIKPASVEYNGIKLTNIGFRTKGNLSLMSVVNSDSDRYSFKLHFDEYISSQSLYGVQAINLNNSFSDPTYMQEVLAYELAEQMGLPTPKYSYVNLYINDELWGFYLAVEQIGDSYLERHFGDSNGSLYKAIMGNGTDLAWVDDSRESYSGLVQKSDYADEEALINMIYELNNGSDYEQVLDVENVLKYIALNVVTNNSDSYIGQNKHNYYLYEQNGVFSVLPWDYNMAFGGMGAMGFGGRGGRFGGLGGFGGRGNMNIGQAAERDPDPAAAQDAQQGEAPGVGQSVAPTEQQGVLPNFRSNRLRTEGNQAGGPASDGQQGAIPGFEGGSDGGFGRFGSNMSVFDPAGGLNRPLVDKLLAVPEYLELYTGYVRDALEGYLATDHFNKRVDEWADLIRDDVKRDPRPFYGYEQFESGIESLKSTNAENVARFTQELEQGVLTATDGNQAAYDNSESEANEVTIARFTGEGAALARFQPGGGGNGPIQPGGMRDGQVPQAPAGDEQAPPNQTDDGQVPPFLTGDGQFLPFPTGDEQFPQVPAGDEQAPLFPTRDRQAQQDDNTNDQSPQDDDIDGQTQPNSDGDGQIPSNRMGNGQFPAFPGFPAGADGQGGGNFPEFGEGGNFPAFGGGGFPGNRQGTATSTAITDEQLAKEYAEIGMALGVMALAAVFIVTFRRRRL